MTIELLWIIPAVAVAFLFFLIAYFAQKRSEEAVAEKDPLAGEVARFNNGETHAGSPTEPGLPERRLGEIEHKIGRLTSALSEQQQVIDRFQRENTSYTTEINSLRKKLRDLHKEYDLVLSENYSLKARVKRLVKTMDSSEQNGHALRANGKAQGLEVHSSEEGGAQTVNMRLYDDTRVMRRQDLDDTSEIDISELG
jgi:peptidoglycan hydrolase CwlO-like protein